MNLNNKLLAQDTFNRWSLWSGDNNQKGTIENPLAGELGKGGTSAGTTIIGNILVSVLNVMIIAGAIMLLIMIIWSGIAWTTSGSDKERLQGAKQRLTNAIVGFIVLICVFAIANFIGSIFGLGWFQDLKIPLPIAGGTI